MKRDDDSLATVFLASRLCAEGMRPLKASEFWELIEWIATVSEQVTGDGSASGSTATPGALLSRTQGQLMEEFGLSEDLAERIVGLVGRATAMAFELERLEQSGIRCLTVFDEHYPHQWLDLLGSKAPPLVHAVGSLELLDAAGIGVVGSRDVSEAGAEIAREAARFTAKRDLPLVSGGARGVDQLAMDAALGAGGTVVGVLAESLLRRLKHPDVRKAVHDGNTALCTPYAPGAPFSAGNAMGRNKLIYAQAALTVVVASDSESGGTWSGATEALKRGYGPVAVWRGPGEGPGNELLEQRGAIAVSSIGDIEAILDGSHSESIPESIQPKQAHTSTATQQALFSSVG